MKSVPVTRVERNRIELFWTAQGYMARWSDAAIIQWFETDTIPTAYTADAPAANVLDCVKRLNPHHDVVMLAKGGA